MNPFTHLTRREFAKTTLLAGAALASRATSADAPPPRIRTGLIGCGSVSHQYLPQLTRCPFVEVVSLCDIKPERAQRQAEKFSIAHHYPHLDAMLAGEPFDFLVDTTDMQEHEMINRRALESGKHVWSEKPIANSLAAGQDLLRLSKSMGTRL
jgi:predicted dehydrogenase